MKLKIFTCLILLTAFLINNAIAQTKPNEIVYEEADRMPVSPGGDHVLDAHFSTHLKPYNIKDRGALVLSFVVSYEGNVEQVKVEKTTIPSIDSIVIKAAEEMPNWSPGQVEGKNVNVRVKLPLYFNYGKDVSVTTAPFEHVDQMPQFVGGKAALNNFINQNLQYPESELKSRTEGTVYVRFLVNINGKVSDPEILKSINPAFDNEVIRLISKMPKWEPGKQFGVEMPVRVTLPVKFSVPVR